MALTNLGALAEQRGNIGHAKELYHQAIAADPSYADAYFNLGTVYWHEADWPKVIEYYSKTLSINPEHQQARIFLEKAKALMAKAGQNQ